MNNKEITSQISIAMLLASFPGAATVLIKRRMACVGCSMAAFESIEDAAGVYGIALADLLSDLRQAAFD